MELQTYFLFTICFISIIEAIKVETKLDFQSDDAKPKYFERVNHKEKRPEKKNDDFNIGIVCVSGGCNATKTKLETSDRTLTDVIVEVKTNVENASANKNKSIGDVPDVPIVVGYGGVPNNALNPNPIVVTNIEQTYPDVKNGNNFLPPLIVPIYNDIPNYGRPYVQRNGYFNPLDFNNRLPKPEWRTPVPWYNRRNYNNNYNNNYHYNRNYPRTTTQSPWTTCTCHQRAAWLPATPSYQPLYKQSAGTQVNDKLAPLN